MGVENNFKTCLEAIRYAAPDKLDTADRRRESLTIKLGVVMDPLASINPRKDSTLAMLEAAHA